MKNGALEEWFLIKSDFFNQLWKHLCSVWKSISLGRLPQKWRTIIYRVLEVPLMTCGPKLSTFMVYWSHRCSLNWKYVWCTTRQCNEKIMIMVIKKTKHLYIMKDQKSLEIPTVYYRSLWPCSFSFKINVWGFSTEKKNLTFLFSTPFPPSCFTCHLSESDNMCNYDRVAAVCKEE